MEKIGWTDQVKKLRSYIASRRKGPSYLQ